MMRKFLAVLVLVAAVPAMARPNLVANGSFEASSVGSNHQIVGDQLTGWALDSSIYKYDYLLDATSATKTPFSYDGGGQLGPDDRRLPASFTGVSPDGGNFVGLDGDRSYTSALTQTIGGLVDHKRYTLTFDWAATQIRNRYGPTTNQFLVSLGNETQSTAMVAVAPQAFTGWMTENFTFTATGTSEVLKFLANGTPAGQPPYALLDGVSLTAVPEPAAWALMLGGFALVGIAARRRGAALAA